MTTVAVMLGVGLLLFVLVAVAGHRLLNSRRAGGSTVAGALGNFIDVFDPARSRSERDLSEHEHKAEVFPDPDGGHPPVHVDLRRGVVRIRRHPPGGEGPA